MMYDDVAADMMEMSMPVSMDLSLAPSSVERPNTPPTVRSHFPESWLWDAKVAG